MRRSLSDPGVLEAFVARFRRLTPANAPVWGTMNAQQMALHVGDASAAALQQREFVSKPRSGPPGLRRLLFFYLVPRMPRGIRSGADPASAAVEPAAFGRDLERAVDLLQQLAAAGPAQLCPKHPIFGPMTRAHWMRWAYLHTDHHLRQFGL